MNLVKDKNNLIFLAFILFFSHFFPFSRESLAPDDYGLINNSNNFFKNFFLYPDRPIQYFFLDLKYFLLKQNILTYNIILIIFNLINIVAVYFFIKLFFNQKDTFLITIIYVLLINKLELYHNPIMIHICAVSTLYILSLYFLIKYINFQKIIFLISSLILFTISIFWYEIGFFISFSIIFYNKNSFSHIKKIKILIPYISIILIYSLLRITNLFGYAVLEQTHSINYDFLNGILEIFKHHLGRYLFKNIIYGFYQFFNYSYTYIILFFIINFLLIFIFYKKIYYKKIEKYNLTFFVSLFILAILPLIINGQSGGRNLIISSISFSIFIFIFFSFFKTYFKFAYIFFVLISLIISQGNNLSQINASKIQKNIFIAFDNNRDLIKSVDYVIFNPKSLTDNIHYTFVKNKNNLLNTYFGAQVWEIWGLRGYLFLNDFDLKSELIIVNKNPEFEKNTIKLSKIYYDDNDEFKIENIVLKDKEVIIFDYSNIFNENFNNY
ncbi:MAG: hypothetical protein CMI90_05880 [Pelagibacteraceae bacterium]|nr:hypothetical protein [Pelagibacteraceae bacterium]|tara:strand:- start:243 stop:1730 length:1488 start_codon:yes stop_codon:yes gene_type:complete